MEERQIEKERTKSEKRLNGWSSEMSRHAN